jgi:hypothetical protein
VPETSEVEQVRRQMARIRCELDENVEQVVESARQMTDWRYYVRAYPWASVGVAFLAGYFVVPRRVEIVRPDADEIYKLAKKNRIVVQDKTNAYQKADRGMGGAILHFVGNLATRTLLAYVGQELGKVAGIKAAESPPPGPVGSSRGTASDAS